MKSFFSKKGKPHKYGKVRRESAYEHIYYCCVQKTASQWLRAVLNDPLVHAYTGLKIHPYRELGLNQAGEIGPFPPRTIVTHLYLNHNTFVKLPKPESYQCFFVTRDPRDAVVSWFYSAKYSHALMSVIPEMRSNLLKLGKDDGMKYIIDKLCDFGYFDAQISWVQSGEKIFRYESIARDHKAFLLELFEYLNIQMPQDKFDHLSAKYAFSRLAGRPQGEENQNSHYRKGEVGDWKNHFNQEIQDYFDARVGDLVERLGYSDREN